MPFIRQYIRTNGIIQKFLSIKKLAAEVDKNHNRQPTVFVDIDQTKLEGGIILTLIKEPHLHKSDRSHVVL